MTAHLSVTVFGPDALPTAITLGVVTSALVFGSVLFHELAHLAARRAVGIETIDVTLFVFGGVARTAEPTRPVREAATVLAGPVASTALGTVLWLFSSPVAGPAGQLFRAVAVGNLVLAGINLLPFAPLDGGRLLVDVAWTLARKRNRGVHLAARGGQIAGAASVFGGAWLVATRFGDAPLTAAGVWFAFVGAFVFSEAARVLRARVVADRVEEGTAGSWARPFTGRVRAETPVPDGGGPYAVADGGRLAGILIPSSVEANRGKQVREAMIPWTPNIGLPADEPLTSALERLASSAAGALVVLDDGGIVRGVLDEETVRSRLGAE